MLKNENKTDNFFILTNVINVNDTTFKRCRSDILGYANAGGTVAFKSYNLKST